MSEEGIIAAIWYTFTTRAEALLAFRSLHAIEDDPVNPALDRDRHMPIRMDEATILPEFQNSTPLMMAHC